MPQNIKQIFRDAVSGTVRLYIPIMVIVEIAYLSEKRRIELSLQTLLSFLEKYSSFQVVELDVDVIKNSFTTTDIPELHDRLIAGTASGMNTVLITNDPLIGASEFCETIWLN